jgi:hypothetical protein
MENSPRLSPVMFHESLQQTKGEVKTNHTSAHAAVPGSNYQEHLRRTVRAALGA